jgi:hypothetical protein
MDDCAECGFAYLELDVADVAERLRSYPILYRDAMSGLPDTLTRRRPEPAVWSALEYLCHVRDVLLIQRDRVVLAQVEDRPSVSRMYRDERVDLCGYSSIDPGDALNQLSMAAGLCALVFSRTSPVLSGGTAEQRGPDIPVDSVARVSTVGPCALSLPQWAVHDGSRGGAMKASVGDRVLVKAHVLGQPARDGEVLEVHGIDGEPPYLVRWSEDGRTVLFFPGPDSVIAPASTPLG